MTRLYHITSKMEADKAMRAGEYTPLRFSVEGFIHCSYREQVVATANRIFRGRSDLVLLEIDKSKLACKVIDENLEGGAELFPHIYGTLPLTAVVRIHDFPCNGAGEFEGRTP
jgi:uncharacterized protein (DUF952 family)